MFKLQPNPTFKTKVEIRVAGERKPPVIEMEFRYLSKPQAREYFDKLADSEDLEALAEVIVGWSGVDQAFSQEALELLLANYPSAAGCIFETFSKELIGAREKN